MLVEITLQDFVFHFRKLPWLEEVALVIPPGADGRKVIMSQAMATVTRPGRPPYTLPSPHEAMTLLASLPSPILRRVWIIYKGSLAEDRFFSTRGLYQAPDVLEFSRQVKEVEAKEEFADEGVRDIARQFGSEAAHDAQEIQQKIFTAARHSKVATQPGAKP